MHSSRVTRFICIFALVLAICAIYAQAQTVNEEFDLNITSERITESNFRRSKEVALEGSEVRLRAGASVSAGRIDLRLFGITGHVRFRASPEFDRLRLRLVPKTPPVTK